VRLEKKERYEGDGPLGAAGVGGDDHNVVEVEVGTDVEDDGGLGVELGEVRTAKGPRRRLHCRG
jgi:hypothetical protein